MLKSEVTDLERVTKLSQRLNRSKRAIYITLCISAVIGAAVATLCGVAYINVVSGTLSALTLQTTPTCSISNSTGLSLTTINPPSFCKSVKFVEDFASCDLTAFQVKRCGSAVNISYGQMDVSLLQECGSTNLQTKAAYSSGYLEAFLKVPGSSAAYNGLVWALYMRSNEGTNSTRQDEIDFEWLGNPSMFQGGTQSNYMIKGEGILVNHIHHFKSHSGSSPYKFVKYGVKFEADSYVEWYINDVKVRRIEKGAVPYSGFLNYPMTARISFWDGSSRGFNQWSGVADWSNYPIESYKFSFKYIMMCEI